jgi:hypothetical protein
MSPPYSGAKNKPRKETGMKQVASRAYYSVLKMEATFYSEKSVDFQRTTWRYIPEDRTLHQNGSLFLGK